MSEAIELGLVRRANEVYEASEERYIRREVTYYILSILWMIFFCDKKCPDKYY